MALPIVTLTMNPALDVASDTAGLRPDHKTRTIDERIDPGGGGINAARTIHSMGGETLALILAGGATGRTVEELMKEQGVPCRLIEIAGRTRLCTAVHDRASGVEYRFVPEGPLVSAWEWKSALTALKDLRWQWLVASGSLPRGVPDDFYVRVAHIAAARGAHLVLDTSGPALEAALACHAAVLKPSLSELEHVAGCRLPDRYGQVAAARGLVKGGAASMVALTLGGDGAILVAADWAIFMPALDVRVRSTVGAGDSFVGALVLALSRGASPEEALRWAAAAGAAAAAAEGTAQVSGDTIRELFARTAGRAQVLKETNLAANGDAPPAVREAATHPVFAEDNVAAA